MSTACTGARQRRRLLELGLDVADLPRLVDVDDLPSARVAAAASPASAFAAALAATGHVEAVA